MWLRCTNTEGIILPQKMLEPLRTSLGATLRTSDLINDTSWSSWVLHFPNSAIIPAPAFNHLMAISLWLCAMSSNSSVSVSPPRCCVTDPLGRNRRMWGMTALRKKLIKHSEIHTRSLQRPLLLKAEKLWIFLLTLTSIPKHFIPIEKISSKAGCLSIYRCLLKSKKPKTKLS